MDNIMPIIIDRERDDSDNFESFFSKMIEQFKAGDENAYNKILHKYKGNFNILGKAGITKPMGDYENEKLETLVKEIYDDINKSAHNGNITLNDKTLFRLIWSSCLARINRDIFPSNIIVELTNKLKTTNWLKKDYSNIKFFIITQDPAVYGSLQSYNSKLKSSNLITYNDVYDRSLFTANSMQPGRTGLQDDVEVFIETFFQTSA